MFLKTRAVLAEQNLSGVYSINDKIGCYIAADFVKSLHINVKNMRLLSMRCQKSAAEEAMIILLLFSEGGKTDTCCAGMQICHLNSRYSSF